MEVVSFDLAVKLKEKGFREKVMYFYDRFRNKWHCLDDLNMNDTENCSAPTISQVLKWLREEKKIHLIVEISDSGWYYTLYPNIRWENGKLKSDSYFMSFKHKESYEHAALAGIKYVIDNLI